MNTMLGGVVSGELRWPTGSIGTFEALVEAHLDSSYRLAAVLLGDRIEAEDATHEAILKAQRSWSTVRDPSASRAWLDRIVVNECRDRLRRRRLARAIVEPGVRAAELAGPGDDRWSADRHALLAALAKLSADHRIVVVLRYLEDLPVEAIAARTGSPAGTVKSRLHHALRLLRAAYDAADRRDLDR